MSKVDEQKGLVDYRKIAEAYGYKPVPDGYEESPVLTLNIDWKSGEQDRIEARTDAIKNFGKISLKSLRGLPNVMEGFLARLQIPKTDEWSHVLEYSQRVESGSENSLILCLIDAKANEIAYFIAVNQSLGMWNLQHRFVAEEYRNQQLGSRMLDEMESLIQAYADEKGEDQEIVLESTQLPVTQFFLSRGYEIVDE